MFILISAILFGCPSLYSQYFTPSWSGGALNPMSIIISSAQLDSLPLTAGDEIGVFDANICVGAMVLQQEVMPDDDQTYLYISCAQDDPGSPEIDGYQSGNPIILCYYDQSESFEGHNIFIDYPFAPEFCDSTFQLMQTSIMQIQASSMVQLNSPTKEICTGNLLELPLLVSGIASADSFLIALDYDTTILRFLSLSNIHHAIAQSAVQIIEGPSALIISKSAENRSFHILQQDTLLLLQFQALTDGNPLLSILPSSVFLNQYGDTLPLQSQSEGISLFPLPIIDDVLLSDESCIASSDGIIRIQCADFGDSLWYSINEGLNWQSEPNFYGLHAGVYSVQVQSRYQCTTIWPDSLLEIEAADSFYFEYAELRDAHCFHQPDGFIRMQVNGGTAAYSYSINNGLSWQDEASFDGLAPGVYDLWAKDSHNCLIPFPDNPVVLSSPAEIIVNQIIVNQATSCAAADGSVFIDASGGEGVLNYSMNNGGQWQENPQFDHLACGDYTLLVKDEENCIRAWQNNPITIDAPTSLWSNSTDNEISVFPNPFQKEISLMIPTILMNSQASVSIYDLSGRQLFEKQYLSLSSRLKINLSFLSAGLYQLRFISPSFQQTIIIQKPKS